ncbi:hypothetical protein B0H19DRAFT_1080609 [Mycena capillaripes]|nr:hypothetical protein B0H19DRAFT_1080609 [Mycena capillaripes]
MYQGDGAEEEWRQDVAKYISFRHPHIIQLCGAASGMHAAIFHDAILGQLSSFTNTKHLPLWRLCITGVNAHLDTSLNGSALRGALTTNGHHLFEFQGFIPSIEGIYSLNATNTETMIWHNVHPSPLRARYPDLILELRSDPVTVALIHGHSNERDHPSFPTTRRTNDALTQKTTPLLPMDLAPQSSIRQLPDDCLQCRNICPVLVFVHVGPWSTHAPLLNVSQVCSTIALNTPSLWGRHSASQGALVYPTRFKATMELLRCVLEREANFPLDVMIRCEDPYSPSLELLAAHCERWRQFRTPLHLLKYFPITGTLSRLESLQYPRLVTELADFTKLSGIQSGVGQHFLRPYLYLFSTTSFGSGGPFMASTRLATRTVSFIWDSVFIQWISGRSTYVTSISVIDNFFESLAMGSALEELIISDHIDEQHDFDRSRVLITDTLLRQLTTTPGSPGLVRRLHTLTLKSLLLFSDNNFLSFVASRLPNEAPVAVVTVFGIQILCLLGHDRELDLVVATRLHELNTKWDFAFRTVGT